MDKKLRDLKRGHYVTHMYKSLVLGVYKIRQVTENEINIRYRKALQPFDRETGLYKGRINYMFGSIVVTTIDHIRALNEQKLDNALAYIDWRDRSIPYEVKLKVLEVIKNHVNVDLINEDKLK